MDNDTLSTAQLYLGPSSTAYLSFRGVISHLGNLQREGFKESYGWSGIEKGYLEYVGYNWNSVTAHGVWIGTGLDWLARTTAWRIWEAGEMAVHMSIHISKRSFTYSCQIHAITANQASDLTSFW